MDEERFRKSSLVTFMIKCNCNPIIFNQLFSHLTQLNHVFESTYCVFGSIYCVFVYLRVSLFTCLFTYQIADNSRLPGVLAGYALSVE